MSLAISLLFAVILVMLFILIIRGAVFPCYLVLAYSTVFQTLPDCGIPLREVGCYLRIVLFLAGVARWKMTGRQVRKLLWGDTLSKFMMLWLVCTVLSYALSGIYTGWGTRATVRMGSYVLLYFAFRSCLKSAKHWRICIHVMAALLIVNGLLGAVQVLLHDPTPVFKLLYANSEDVSSAWEGRAVGLVSAGSNALGGFLNLYIPFVLLGAVLSRGRLRWIYAFAALCGCTGVVLSGSRGAVASLVVIVFLAMYCFSAHRITRILAVITTCGLLPITVILISIFSPRVLNVDQRVSVDERYLLYAEAFAKFKTHPVFGIGTGNLRELGDSSAVGGVAQGAIEASNVYLQFLCDTGIVGAGIFFGLCGHILYINWRKLRLYRARTLPYAAAYAMLAAMLSVLLQGFVDVMFTVSTEFGSAFVIVIVLSAAVDSVDKRYRAMRNHPKVTNAFA